MKLITYGGIGNLPTVAEGAAYTELTVDDVKETASFTKKGGYVGITMEMIRNSNIVEIQAVPKALAIAAVRTRSAAVSALFTANAGVGPTLAQDSTALFHANHNNVGHHRPGTGRMARDPRRMLPTHRSQQRQSTGRLPQILPCCPLNCTTPPSSSLATATAYPPATHPKPRAEA